MNVTFLGYREWALKVLEGLLLQKKKWKVKHVISTRNSEASYARIGDGVRIDYIDGISNEKMNSCEVKDLILSHSPDVTIVCGWSWLLDQSTLDQSGKNLGVHISPLPKYRGGSPIQHQIIGGERESAVSIFEMREGLDDGPIYTQVFFPLDGHLDAIFKRIESSAIRGLTFTLDGLVDGTITPKEQDVSKATIYKRRRQSESEITVEDLRKGKEHLWNKIRALEPPYPSAYFKVGDRRLLIKRAEYSDGRLTFTDLAIEDGNKN